MKPKQKNKFYNKHEPNIRGLKANHNGNARNMAKTGLSAVQWLCRSQKEHDMTRFGLDPSTVRRSGLPSTPIRREN